MIGTVSVPPENLGQARNFHSHRALIRRPRRGFRPRLVKNLALRDMMARRAAAQASLSIDVLETIAGAREQGLLTPRRAQDLTKVVKAVLRETKPFRKT